MDLDAFAAHLAGSFIPNAVIIDATASEAPAEHYESWMRAGVNVITPNKKACLLLPMLPAYATCLLLPAYATCRLVSIELGCALDRQLDSACRCD